MFLMRIEEREQLVFQPLNSLNYISKGERKYQKHTRILENERSYKLDSLWRQCKNSSLQSSKINLIHQIY